MLKLSKSIIVDGQIVRAGNLPHNIDISRVPDIALEGFSYATGLAGNKAFLTQYLQRKLKREPTESELEAEYMRRLEEYGRRQSERLAARHAARTPEQIERARQRESDRDAKQKRAAMSKARKDNRERRKQNGMHPKAATIIRDALRNLYSVVGDADQPTKTELIEYIRHNFDDIVNFN